MDGNGNQGIKNEARSQLDGHPATNGPALVNRRDCFRIAVGGGVGLALDGLLDLPTVRAAAQKLKLANVREFTTSCNFCSCGCGMIAAVREGKLTAMEGDYDHIVNRGSLCVKGISMFATHNSPNRLMTPRHRAPDAHAGIGLPLRCQFLQVLFGLGRRGCAINRLQIRGHRLAHFPGHIVQRSPHYMHDASCTSVRG